MPLSSALSLLAQASDDSFEYYIRDYAITVNTRVVLTPQGLAAVLPGTTRSSRDDLSLHVVFVKEADAPVSTTVPVCPSDYSIEWILPGWIEEDLYDGDRAITDTHDNFVVEAF